MMDETTAEDAKTALESNDSEPSLLERFWNRLRR